MQALKGSLPPVAEEGPLRICRAQRARMALRGGAVATGAEVTSGGPRGDMM